MTKETIIKLLSDVFVPRAEGLEGVCFASDFMDREQKDKYAIYNAISEAMQNSGLSHNFSYGVANKAVSILSDIDWNDDDAITDAIDHDVPIYNGELMSIYAQDWHAVDEACNEYGIDDEADSIERAKQGWYYTLTNMTNDIKSNLESLI